jgi:NAD binding domain of 6-phosphogluconate dehydrogenase
MEVRPDGGGRGGTDGVGFIGLGLMGAHRASNVLKAGYRLTVYNWTAVKVATLGRPAPSRRPPRPRSPNAQMS